MVPPKDEMSKTFNQFRGAQAWAARKLNVNRVTVWKYLNGLISSRMLDEEMPRIAAMLIETNGKCIDSANGKSVRSQLRRLRAMRKRKAR
jgi:hypothetical protein